MIGNTLPLLRLILPTNIALTTPCFSGSLPLNFSQWTPGPLIVDGVRSNCEKYFAAAKARLFRDNDTLREILHVSSRVSHKNLGRKICGFDDRVWARDHESVVVTVSYYWEDLGMSRGLIPYSIMSATLYAVTCWLCSDEESFTKTAVAVGDPGPKKTKAFEKMATILQIITEIKGSPRVSNSPPPP